jgi:hypothetical protein
MKPGIFFVKIRLKPLVYNQVKKSSVVEVTFQLKFIDITLRLVATACDETGP